MNTNPNRILEKFKAQELEERATEDEKREKEWQETLANINKTKSKLTHSLRPAPFKDYHRWLIGYVERGGKPTHYYDYDTPSGETFIAFADFDLGDGLYGASSINIIIPEGIRFIGGNQGHCNLYYMDGFRHSGHFVPVYKDT